MTGVEEAHADRPKASGLPMIGHVRKFRKLADHRERYGW